MRLLGNLPRRVRAVLVTSLALNLAVLGIGLGAVLNGDDGARERRGGPPAAPLVRALPGADRAVVMDALRDGPRPPKAARRERFEVLLGALRAEPFEAERVAALLAEQRAFGDRRAEAAERAVIARLSRMDGEDRAAFAERLEKDLRRR